MVCKQRANPAASFTFTSLSLWAIIAISDIPWIEGEQEEEVVAEKEKQ